MGYTSDLKTRLEQHNETGTSGWTLRYRPWVFLHVEVFETKREAILREKYYKTGVGRDFIKTLIEKADFKG